MNRRHLASITSPLIVLALTVSSCGGAEPTKDTNTPRTPSADRPSMDAGQFDKIRECLKAAGLADDLPSDLPSGRPSDMPSERPTDRPTDMPSGGPGALFNSPEARRALEACGIEMPEMPQSQ